MKKILFFFLLLSTGNFFFAQFHHEREPVLSHPLNNSPQKKFGGFVYQQLPETLYVYAIRVQFKQFNDPNTTGDGRFDLSNNYPDSVDAPPHDSTYFLDHLEFLKNYYYKVSKGKLIIKYRLLGSVRNMSSTMSVYSPLRNENLLKLGNLFYEAWTSVDSVVDFTGIDPAKSAFIIFHAGAGRDIDLTSQGVFEGQLDLPSVFLSNATLKGIYGDTTRGYYTKEGVIIPSSCMLPEQEYRVIGTSFGSSFLELGINGITVASIGSNLGLPDLFDTRTGNTAIGRFGLMDGQSIFSFSGVFPPEPSAWEKQYLGWVNPIPVYSDGDYISRAASLDLPGNSSVYKVFISAKEYFLVENRNRDAKKNGQKIYFVNNGVPDSTTAFTQDQDGFQNGDVWKLKKDIIDVDEYDWSLPGLINDTAANSGGILIWHIDENVIDANFASNTINTDINHRGVDLEEAKGSQDIGVVISTPFGQFIGDGTPYDYWFNGNHYVPSNIYLNEFTPTSFPNSRSYSNLNSRVCLTNFSTIDSSMIFHFQQCGTITNINKYPRFVGIDSSSNAQPIGIDYNNNGQDEVFINVKDSLYGFRDNGNPIRVDMPNGFLKDSVSSVEVGYLPFITNNPNRFITGVYQNKFNLLSFTIDSLTSAPNVLQIAANSTLTVPTLYNNVFDPIAIVSTLYSATVDGKIAKLSTDSLHITYDSVTSRRIVELARTSGRGYAFLDQSYKYFTLGKLSSHSTSDDTVIVEDGLIYLNHAIISNHLGISSVNCSPVLADINNDGNQEIIFTADDKVFAINRAGVVIDHFPFSVTGISSITSGVAVADLNGDGIYDVIFGTGDGRVYAYGADGRILDGFPLLTGKVIKSTPAIVNTGGNFGLVVYSTDGYLYGWKTPWIYNESKILWRNYLGDKYHRNSNFNVSAVSISGPCLPADKVYNWPNPVYGNTTNIRYFLNTAATSVKVRIMDLSGELVTTLNGPAVSGLDNEVVWDVSNVQSGIYIGVIELQGSSCSETPSIKIAVVK